MGVRVIVREWECDSVEMRVTVQEWECDSVGMRVTVPVIEFQV